MTDCSVTPLYVASGFNGIDVCALLLAHKADVNGSTNAACCHASALQHCGTHNVHRAVQDGRRRMKHSTAQRAKPGRLLRSMQHCFSRHTICHAQHDHCATCSLQLLSLPCAGCTAHRTPAAACIAHGALSATLGRTRRILLAVSVSFRVGLWAAPGRFVRGTESIGTPRKEGRKEGQR